MRAVGIGCLVTRSTETGGGRTWDEAFSLRFFRLAPGASSVPLRFAAPGADGRGLGALRGGVVSAGARTPFFAGEGEEVARRVLLRLGGLGVGWT